jgi:hypothetical protein
MPRHADPTQALVLLEGWADEQPNGLMRRSEVIDRLLDLRAAADGLTLVVTAIEDRLRDVPGVTVTTAEWWREQVGELRLLVSTLVAHPSGG